MVKNTNELVKQFRDTAQFRKVGFVILVVLADIIEWETLFVRSISTVLPPEHDIIVNIKVVAVVLQALL